MGPTFTYSTESSGTKVASVQVGHHTVTGTGSSKDKASKEAAQKALQLIEAEYVKKKK